ncbi:hypothetical protein A0H81_02792 [Grifola frondosa]|uniref:Uncharacterized protein n=1 Tax=Grifola frondosa TaxID=5627 RepID=A0A1C7ML02_GRIFR|nr:hypothetical protein A0H81_02792 [Grifola frondosa]
MPTSRKGIHNNSVNPPDQSESNHARNAHTHPVPPHCRVLLLPCPLSSSPEARAPQEHVPSRGALPGSACGQDTRACTQRNATGEIRIKKRPELRDVQRRPLPHPRDMRAVERSEDNEHEPGLPVTDIIVLYPPPHIDDPLQQQRSNLAASAMINYIGASRLRVDGGVEQWGMHA